MSNTEARPVETRCGGRSGAAAPAAVEILTAREVPLGGPRAMPVRRTLPQRARTLIGAWCFADHYGPDDVSRTGGMDVAPHPPTPVCRRSAGSSAGRSNTATAWAATPGSGPASSIS
ncbi:hypothetical protein GCM10020295_08590 [Streptomyces cinereospinus]